MKILSPAILLLGALGAAVLIACDAEPPTTVSPPSIEVSNATPVPAASIAARTSIVASPTIVSSSLTGLIERPDLGFSIRFPGSWEAAYEDVIPGPATLYPAGSDWTLHSVSRQHRVGFFADPNVTVRVVSSPSSAGRQALASYYDMLTKLTQ